MVLRAMKSVVRACEINSRSMVEHLDYQQFPYHFAAINLRNNAAASGFLDARAADLAATNQQACFAGNRPVRRRYVLANCGMGCTATVAGSFSSLSPDDSSTAAGELTNPTSSRTASAVGDAGPTLPPRKPSACRLHRR